jgi:hypothetical protein
MKVIEVSRGARALFENLLPEAALFQIPSSAFVDGYRGIAIDNLLGWRSAGVIPFPYVAIEHDDVAIDSRESRLGVEGRSVSLFTLTERDTLAWITRSDLSKNGRSERYFAHFDQRGMNGEVSFLDPAHDAENIDRRIGEASVPSDLYIFEWLLEALRSTRYTAIEEKTSRQLARSTGEPRTRWIIEVRSRGSAAPKLADQFREAMRAAHAVRGHLRTDHRTGEKSIRVRPHIRGIGDGVQLKDYIVLGGSKA